jgi:hypothetical protein
MHVFTLFARRLVALAIIFFSFWIWTNHSDVMQLIVLQRPVLFGRYAQGPLGILIVATPILWALAGALWSKRPLGQTLINCVIGSVTTVLTILFITYIAHFFHRGPRYVESALPAAKLHSMRLVGSVRRRPPNQSYTLVYKDAPEQARSYPNAPPGHSDINIQLTTDANGFRNPRVEKHYDIVAVGDSFVAGSNVSDEQTWTHLLARATGKSIYNLGVGGSGPPTYLSNFVYFGVDLNPRTAIFVIYEGNDFKENVILKDPLPPTVGERIGMHFDDAMHSSPVTVGLQRLSRDLFERIGSTRPVPGYQEKLGFMPIKIGADSNTSYYSFDPKRALYLNYSKEEFAASPEWQATANILRQIIQLCRDNTIQPIFVYAPSTPHVILPLVRDAIPADQLHFFMSLRQSKLPAADVLKQQLFANLDNEQDVVLDFCAQQQLDCLALTDALRTATTAGMQTYFSYDQHWTPEGNAVAASAIEKFLREKNYLN